MDGRYIVHGSPGSGSVPVEAALTLIGAPYEVIGDTVLRDVARNPAVFKVNPLGQVPALVIPGGEVMTESAAILIWRPIDIPMRLWRHCPATRGVQRFYAGWPTSPRQFTGLPGCEAIPCVLSRTSAR